jgi:hypothetical protein
MGLNIGILTVKELFGPGDGQIFGFVYKFASSVVSFARISFGVFVG